MRNPNDLSFITQLPIAHRGLHNKDEEIIENSYGSVKAAIDHGYAIEIDVQITKDQKAVVFHDESLDRLVKTKGTVADYTMDELCQMEYEINDEKILSFPDLLKMVDGQVPLIVEIKSILGNEGPLEAYIAEQVSQYQGDIAIMSFNPKTVKIFNEQYPDIIRGIVAEHHMDDEHWPGLSGLEKFMTKNLLHWGSTNPDFISYHVHDLPKFVLRIMKRRGVPIITWTVKNEADATHTYKYADQITFENFLPKK